MADILVSSAGTIVNIALQIKEAVETVRHNEEECRKIARCVDRNSAILKMLAEETDITKAEVMRDALEDAKTTFEDALKLVKKCQNRHIFRRFFSAKDMANELNIVMRDIGLIIHQATLCGTVHNATKIHFAAPTTASPVHRPPPPPPLPPEEEDIEVSPFGFRRFSLSVLKKATNNFSVENMIGHGGFAVVYKGVLSDGREVAIKKFNIDTLLQKEQMCTDEFIVGTKLRHKNVVSVLGYCLDTQGVFVYIDSGIVLAERRVYILVLGYVPNGSLDQIVRGTPHNDWSSCFKIIQEIAEGVHYIHERRVIHSDLKPSNILFNSDMTPVIVDFGLSKVLQLDEDKIVTEDIAGGFGYMSPELITAGELSLKSDVYSFGIVIFYTICGKDKDLDEIPEDPGRMKGIVNRAIQFDESQLPEIKRCLELVRLCIQFDPADRPSMSDVVDMLSGKERLPAPKKPASLFTKKLERSATKKPGRADSRT